MKIDVVTAHTKQAMERVSRTQLDMALVGERRLRIVG